MPKYMNVKDKYFSSKLNLQLFADDGEDGAGDDAGDGDDQDENQDDTDADEGGDDEPKYTQADLDKAVARTIAKERAKAERKARREKKEKEAGSSEESEDVKARKEAEGKASKLEVKVACFEADVAKDAVDDVAALAHAYMEADTDLDLEDAIEKVVKKYPHFKKGADSSGDDADDAKGKSWGERQRGARKKRSGVEEAFLKKNPGLKID